MNLDQLGKMIIALGIILVMIGIAIFLGGRIGFGRLPGDIMIKRENFTFYFPIVTCIAISAILTVVMWLIRLISGR